MVRVNVIGNIVFFWFKYGLGDNIDYKMVLIYLFCNNYIYLIGEGNVGKLVMGNGWNYW